MESMSSDRRFVGSVLEGIAVVQVSKGRRRQ